jgi:WD40 repeat protein
MVSEMRWVGLRAMQPVLHSLVIFLTLGLVPAGHHRSVETVSFSPDSKQLASGGWDKQVILWEVQVCKRLGPGKPWVSSGGSLYLLPSWLKPSVLPPTPNCPFPSRHPHTPALHL